MRNALRVLESLALLKSEPQQLNVGLKLDWLLVSLIASLASLESAVIATLVFVGSLSHFLEKYHSANKRKLVIFICLVLNHLSNLGLKLILYCHKFKK